MLIDLLLIKFYFVDQNKPIRHRRSRQEVEALLNLYANSNTGVKDFCKQHNISAANFHKWKSRYKSNEIGRKKVSGFATLDIVSSSQATVSGLFAEVKGIRIYQPVSASFLKELVA